MAHENKQHQPGTWPGGANNPKPDSNRDCKDKSDDGRNLSNPHDYQTNGFKKHRDQTPI